MICSHPCQEELPSPLASPLGIPEVLFTMVVAKGPVACTHRELSSLFLCPLHMQLLGFYGVGGSVQGMSLGPVVPSLKKE